MGSIKARSQRFPEKGPRVMLDPDHLISGDTTAVSYYITRQLAKVYTTVNANAAQWNSVRKEVEATINKVHELYQQQSKKAADRKKLANRTVVMFLPANNMEGRKIVEIVITLFYFSDFFSNTLK